MTSRPGTTPANRFQLPPDPVDNQGMEASKHDNEITIRYAHVTGVFYGSVEIETPTEYGVRWDSGYFTYVRKASVTVREA